MSGESARALGRRRVLPSPLPESSSEDSDDSDQTDDVTDDESTPVVKHQLTPVEKASAMTEYIAAKAKCEGRKDLGINALCLKYGVGKNQLSRWLKTFVLTGSVERKTRSCTPYKLTAHVQKCIEKIARRRRWDFTYREMVTELKARYGVALSPETIRSGLIIGGSWRVYSERDKPSLSPRHMEARLAWAKDHLGSRWVDHVDIDEKWFYEFAHKRKLKQPITEPRVYRFTPSRSNPVKVMFLVAVACPRPDKNFDGLVGMWRIQEAKVAKRNSKNHQRGDTYMEDCTLNAEKFREIMLGRVYRAIRRKMNWAKVVTLQMDGALPHTGMGNPDVLAARGKKARHGGPTIQPVIQPSMSPDLNVLDLCMFPSMSARCSKHRSRNKKQIARIAEKCFRLYPSEVLVRAWEMKTRVLSTIVEHGGNNDFELPHRDFLS